MQREILESRATNEMYFPAMRTEDSHDPCFFKVFETSGPTFLVKKTEVKPAVMLMNGLVKGWQIIALTLILAALSGIVIWSFVSNHNLFPSEPFRGIPG